ncbi:hypothetical protein CHS0354_005950, partial [Potamilus streckersoni]
MLQSKYLEEYANRQNEGNVYKVSISMTSTIDITSNKIVHVAKPEGFYEATTKYIGQNLTQVLVYVSPGMLYPFAITLESIHSCAEFSLWLVNILPA